MVITMDINTILMASIFQKAYPIRPNPSIGEFLHHFELEIDRTCRMLKFLGLVTEAPSTLGYKPTDRLINVIVDRMVRANTEGNNPVAKVEADCFGWLWQLVTRDLGNEHNVGVDKNVQVVDETVLKAVSDDREDEQDALNVEDELEENDDLDEDWDEESDDADKADGSGQQFCCKVFVLLGLLKVGYKRYVPTRLMANLFLESCFQQLSNKS